MSDGKMWEIEDGFFSGGVGTICGVDEAGRGPLAGPVYAAAVILPPHLDIPGLTDSKKLTDKKRRELFPIIQEQAIAYGIGFATEKEIDEINILQATFLAMERALGQLAVKPDLVLIDGNREKNFGIPVKPWSRGTVSAPISPRRRCWPRSPGTTLCWKWRSSTPSMALTSTRAIPHGHITTPSAHMVPVPSTG